MIVEVAHRVVDGAVNTAVVIDMVVGHWLRYALWLSVEGVIMVISACDCNGNRRHDVER